MIIMQKYKTINSFTQTPSFPQIISYLLFIIKAILYYIFIQPNYRNQVTKITTLIIYSIIVVSHFGVTLVVSLIDPSDEIIIKSKNQPEYCPSSAELNNFLYCQICKSYVKNQSRHCKLCRRCVQNFDHHCIWINNCIGGKNYRLFIFMIVLAFVSLLMFIICMALLWSQNQYSLFLPQMGVIWGYSIISAFFMVLILNLIIFHVYIGYLGITTFDFIQRNKQKSIQQQNIEYNSKKKGGEATEQNIVSDIKKQKVIEMMQQIAERKQQNNESQQDNSGVRKASADLSQPNKLANKCVEIELENNIFDVKDTTDKQISPVNNYFSRSKSLKILVNSAAIVPSNQHTTYTKKNSLAQPYTIPHHVK